MSRSNLQSGALGSPVEMSWTPVNLQTYEHEKWMFVVISQWDLGVSIDWMFVSPHTSCWNLIPSVMVLRGGAFGRWWGHEGGALRNRISVLIKETPESSLTPSAMWGPREKTAIYEPGSGFHQTPSLLVPWSWTSQPPELWETMFYCL